MVKLDDTRTRIISAAIRAVRQHGLEGVRIQNVSSLAGVSPGALYRYFESKEKLLEECFTYVDRQAAAIFDQLAFDPHAIVADPVGAVKSLWLPYFRFWVAHPDETVFYHRPVCQMRGGGCAACRPGDGGDGLPAAGHRSERLSEAGDRVPKGGAALFSAV